MNDVAHPAGEQSLDENKEVNEPVDTSSEATQAKDQSEDDDKLDGSNAQAEDVVIEKKVTGSTRLREKAARLEQELEFWRKQALKSEATAAPAHQEVEPDEPQISNFDNMSDFMRAHDAWFEQKVLDKVAGVVQQKNHHSKVEAEHLARIELAKREIPDYVEVMMEAQDNDLRVPADAYAFMLESEVGPKLAYHFAKNPSDLERISKLSQPRRFAELGKLEDRFSQSAAPTPKKVSSAPPKLSDVKGGSDATPVGRPRSYTEWKAQQAKLKDS